MTVRDIRRIFEDCWVRVICYNRNDYGSYTIFDQAVEKTKIPDEIADLEVDFCFVDDPYSEDDGEFIEDQICCVTKYMP